MSSADRPTNGARLEDPADDDRWEGEGGAVDETQSERPHIAAQGSTIRPVLSRE